MGGAAVIQRTDVGSGTGVFVEQEKDAGGTGGVQGVAEGMGLVGPLVTVTVGSRCRPRVRTAHLFGLRSIESMKMNMRPSGSSPPRSSLVTSYLLPPWGWATSCTCRVPRVHTGLSYTRGMKWPTKQVAALVKLQRGDETSQAGRPWETEDDRRAICRQRTRPPCRSEGDPPRVQCSGRC